MKCPFCHTERTGDPARVPCPYCGQTIHNDPRFRRAVASKSGAPAKTSVPVAVQHQQSQKPLQNQNNPEVAKQIRVNELRQKLRAVQQQRVSGNQKIKPPLVLRAFNMLLVFTCFLAWLGFMQVVAGSFKDTACWSRCSEMAPFVAGSAFLFFILPRKSFIRWFFGLAVMGFSAFVLIMKPIVAPTVSSWSVANPDGSSRMESYTLSFTSETHMFYWVPGAILAFVTAIALLTGLGKIFKKMTS